MAVREISDERQKMSWLGDPPVAKGWTVALVVVIALTSLAILTQGVKPLG